ncbi:MAG: 3',5'-cyclic-AMP phosphodiesterase [Sedimenticola sp.]|uniref:3',5'-cyclic-AMP phosphodiesterase n=1 Tax=Sedimenticola thiotaurini TaxID=1543721 RepID=A0A558D9C3_9GAMM|nr:3',5'-cyclic-AMP phosphodiesterase [Sedimenticola sp.]TVT57628.1 MAG: 3',5'-cyclic-AMP phosphodiesterase [Sedimenticola thiotaurini]MCW8920705.1 3',5'-cyclic-AMP phosphodiesterase [Sedimenticola sp.]MCW8947599.1 3',5'-cyclic-AMP phosphodiesterase [Sedimenticola sp.]MCW8950863.1 3',5'-cyclic-AMP phosphodiesterase [Sedimenticola sp.]
MTQEITHIHRQPKDRSNQEMSLRILQITDCHLQADPEWKLAGINTQTSFEWVMDLASQDPKRIDLILLTGDLVHDASVEGYRRLNQHIQSFGIRTCCLPGNHDKPAELYKHLTGGLIEATKVIDLGSWVVVMLDSTIPHSEGGHLRDQELELLQQSLHDYADRPVLIALHHHPIKINSAWMDNMALDNPGPFLSILDQNKNAKGVIWGHIHQNFETVYNGIQMLGTPSTCIQFVENQDSFGISTAPPGFRWLELRPDGSISTGIERVAALPPGLDLKTAGY